MSLQVYLSRGKMFLPPIVITNTRLQVFQYKKLNNALYLNKHLYIFKLSDTKLCSFYNQEDETVIHLLTVLKVKHEIA